MHFIHHCDVVLVNGLSSVINWSTVVLPSIFCAKTLVKSGYPKECGRIFSVGASCLHPTTKGGGSIPFFRAEAVGSIPFLGAKRLKWFGGAALEFVLDILNKMSNKKYS